jgi:hypothetical protein
METPGRVYPGWGAVSRTGELAVCHGVNHGYLASVARPCVVARSFPGLSRNGDGGAPRSVLPYFQRCFRIILNGLWFSSHRLRVNDLRLLESPGWRH